MFTATALGLGLAACTSGSEEPQASPEPETSAPTPDSPAPEQSDGQDSPTPTDDEALFDGSRQVDVLTYGDRLMATSVEGGLVTVSDGDESEVPTTWVIEPVTGGSTADDVRYLLRSTATTDARDLCLNAPGDGVLGLEECDESSPSQHLDIGSADRTDEVNISTADGYLVAEPDGGLALAPDPASPGTIFSLVDRGRHAARAAVRRRPRPPRRPEGHVHRSGRRRRPAGRGRGRDLVGRRVAIAHALRPARNEYLR